MGRAGGRVEESSQAEVQPDPYNYQHNNPMVFGHHRLYACLFEKEESAKVEIGGIGQGEWLLRS